MELYNFYALRGEVSFPNFLQDSGKEINTEMNKYSYSTPLRK